MAGMIARALGEMKLPILTLEYKAVNVLGKMGRMICLGHAHHIYLYVSGLLAHLLLLLYFLFHVTHVTHGQKGSGISSLRG
jgi:hypothetical protein